MKLQLVASTLVSVCLLTGCVYQPYLTDIPLIHKKKELRADAAISAIPTINATLSYGLTDKIAIQTYGSLGADERYLVQGAIGYYKNLANSGVMEIYGGVGDGYGSAFRDANPGDLFGSSQVYFTQFNMGKINCKFAHSDFGIGLKVGILHSKLTDHNFYEIYSYQGPWNKYVTNSLLIEPTGFVRFGGEKFKFNLKIGGCFLEKISSSGKEIPYSHFNLGLGICYDF